MNHFILESLILRNEHSKYSNSVPNTMEHKGYKSVAEIDDRHRSEETIPKPKHKINLLVDDVLGQDT